MAAPLVSTKFHQPDQPDRSVARPRLIDRLEGARRSRLTVIAAPAGFGKTTVLTQWLASTTNPSAGQPPAVAWVSLDTRDSDSGTFWTYVVTALQGVVAKTDGVGVAALDILRSRQPSSDAAITTLVNDLEQLEGEVLLVLDDYHVIEASDIHEAMAYFVDHIPANTHVILATRTDPALPLARLRARGELVEVRSADLRFTDLEAAEYLAGPMHLTLTANEIATLAERTEGWAAALQLAGLSLRDRDDTSEAVAKFAGDERFIVDYLVEEVLDRQTGDIRSFLLATSVLDRLTGSLCDAVSGQTGGASTLLELERSNLFLVSLDDNRTWYRYHHLFADVLRSHLVEQGQPSPVLLHQRAAEWLYANGDSAGAIQHALAAQDFDRAAELMELTMPDMRRDRREGELAGWVGQLPEDVVSTRPVLAVQLVGALAQVSNFDGLESRLDDVEKLLRPDGGRWPDRPPAGLVVVDDDAYRSLPATVAMYRAALALVSGDLESSRAHAREALSEVPADDDLVRGGAGAIEGLASWAMGDLASAHDAYSESVVAMRKVGHLADVLGLCVTLGDLCRAQGQLNKALDTYQDALRLTATEPGRPPLRGTADMHTGISGVMLERYDLAAVAEHLELSGKLGEHNGLPQNAYRWRVVSAGLSQAQGDLDGALDLLDEAITVYNGDYSPNVQPVPAVRARLQLRRGALSDADEWVRGADVAPDDELSYLREYEHVTLARVLLARHQVNDDDTALADSASLLQQLNAASSEAGRVATEIETLILLALAHQAADDVVAAQEALRRAVTTGRSESYVRLFAEEGRPIATLLTALAKQEKDRDTLSYLRRLAAAATKPVRAIAEEHGELIEPLSERELEVLRLLATDLSGPEIARELHVSLNTMRTHSRNVFRKLQVSSRRAAVRRATDLGLLPRP